MSGDQTTKKKSSLLVRILIVLFGLGVVGVLVLVGAAIVMIPAMTRMKNKSIATEARLTLMQMESAITVNYISNCAFPAPIPEQGAVPSGDAKAPLATPEVEQRWRDLNISLNNSQRFVYSLNKKDDRTYILRARRDFEEGGPMHTAEITLNGDPDGCDVDASEVVVTNELQ